MNYCLATEDKALITKFSKRVTLEIENAQGRYKSALLGKPVGEEGTAWHEVCKVPERFLERWKVVLAKHWCWVEAKMEKDKSQMRHADVEALLREEEKRELESQDVKEANNLNCPTVQDVGLHRVSPSSI